MDGLQIHHYLKTVLCILIAIIATIDTFRYTFDLNEYSLSGLDTTFTFNAFGESCNVNMIDWIRSTYAVLAIFIWKQTMITLLWRNYATIIRSWSKIKWTA